MCSQRRLPTLGSNAHTLKILSAVRTAMVSLMRADVPEEFGAITSPPVHVAEGEPYCLVESNDLPEGCWSKAVPAGDGQLLPGSSTCLLWCAVALGALVRGCPLTNVGRLVATSTMRTIRRGVGFVFLVVLLVGILPRAVYTSTA